MNDARKSQKRLRYLPLVALALLGAVGGYLFYRFVGRASCAARLRRLDETAELATRCHSAPANR